MKRIITLAPVFVALAFASCLSAQQNGTVYYSNSPDGPPQTQAAPAQGVRQVAVPDPKYNMTAYTVAIPDGWRFGGEIMRNQDCHSMGMAFNYKMESADSLTAVIQLAGVKWHWDNDPWMSQHMRPQCEPVQIASASGFLINVLLPEVRPHAKIVSVVPPSAEQQRDLAQMEEQSRQNYALWAQQAGTQPPQHNYVDAVSVRLQYDINGQPVEELVSAVIECYGGTNPNIFHPRYPPITNLTCNTRPERIVRAPQGQLDAFLASQQLAGLLQGIQPNQQWWMHDAQVVQMEISRDRQISQAAIAASWNNFNAMQRSNQALYDQLSASNRQFNQNLVAQGQRSIAQAQSQQNARDAEAHRWINFAGDKADFTNSVTGQTVALSNKYSNTFFSQDGTTAIQTNGFNPNDVPGSGVWTQAQPH
jgi:hypothetical protein